MNDDKNELIKAVTTGAMVSILSGLVRALIVKKEPILDRIRVFFASVCFGILVAIILRNVEISEFKRETFISIATAFGYSMWPELEKLVIKWVKKGEKVNDILHSDDN